MFKFVRHATRLSLRPFSVRHFSSKKNEFFHKDGTKMTDAEIEAMNEANVAKAQASEQMWKALTPDRYMGVTSPAFGILLFLCVTLFLYNEYQDTKEMKNGLPSESDVEKELREKAESARRERLAQLKAQEIAQNQLASQYQQAMNLASQPQAQATSLPLIPK